MKRRREEEKSCTGSKSLSTYESRFIKIMTHTTVPSFPVPRIQIEALNICNIQIERRKQEVTSPSRSKL